MARSWQYPRWRRYVMQAVMWLLLGATLALAAFVNHERRRALRVELGPPRAHGTITVRLPRDWPILSQADGDPRVIVRAAEPTESTKRRAGDGRSVTILRERLPDARGPLEHLLITISQTAAVHGPAEWADATESVEIGNWPGLMVSLEETQKQLKRQQPEDEPLEELPEDLPDVRRARPKKSYVACAVLPSRHAIVIRLESTETNEAADVEVLKQIAAGIEVTGQPPLGQPGETVALEGGARVTAPDGLRPVYENEPNRIARQLWGGGDARSWTSCQLVPILIAPQSLQRVEAPVASRVEAPDKTLDKTLDEKRAIVTALHTHDRRLRDATVTDDGPRRWRVALPRSSFSDLFPTAAYVIADEHSDRGAISAGPRRAVLAVFRGAPGTESRFADAWDAIARGVSFVGETHYAAMLATGEAEARRLADRGMARLLRGPRDEQWWLWFDEDENVNLGWSDVVWDLAGASALAPSITQENVGQPNVGPPAPAGRRRTVRRGPDGRLVDVTEEWDGDLRRYDLRCDTAGPDGWKQTATLDGGEIVTSETARGKRIGEWRGLAPPQFVPGAWLSMLVGDLTRHPMILRTDSFTGHEGSAPLEPMTLIVTHAAEPATRSALDGTPLRCVTVHVNGSGELSRWYFREDGRLERTEFASGLRRVPSDAKSVRFTFKDDEGMKP